MGAVAAIVTGRLLGIIGPGVVMLISMVAFTIGNILLATAPIRQTYWAATFVATLVTPLGRSLQPSD